MKQLTTLMCATLLASAVFAQARTFDYASAPEAANSVKAARTEVQASKIQALKKTPMTSLNAPEKVIVAETPAGECKTYIREAFYFYMLFGGAVGQSYTTEFASDIIFADNNEVYFKNPFSDTDIAGMIPGGMWMKGTLDGDKITVQFPQDVMKDPAGNVYSLNRMKLVITDPVNERCMYFIDEENQTVTYTIESDGSIVMEESLPYDEVFTEPDMILGMTDAEGNWCGYGDWDQIYTPFSSDITLMPNDVTVERPVMRYNVCSGKNVGFAIKGNEVYINDLFAEIPLACIKGTISGDKVSFPAHQFVGISAEWSAPIYFWAGEYEWVEDPVFGDGMRLVPKEELVFDYDAAKKILSTEASLILNLNDEELAYVDLFNMPLIYPPVEDMEITNPENPEFLQILPYNPDPEYKYGHITFALPMFDLNGNMLDTSKMYYNILFGGQKYTFTTDEYIELKEDMTDIPFDFLDSKDYGGYDFKISGKTTHRIYFYDPKLNLEKAQVQLFYKDDAGNIFASDVVTNGSASVEDIDLVGKTVVSTTFTNLQGMTVANPETGLYIKTTVYSDGSREVVKQLFK